MAGLTEVLADPADDFWSWRQWMYRFAGKIGPETLGAVARQLYTEMLKAGYTSVCEFHYLHHRPGGKGYSEPSELALRVVDAATDRGLGMTLLPVLYQYSGFGNRPPTEGQSRFLGTPEGLLGLIDRMRTLRPSGRSRAYGAAPHSLRAVSPEGLDRLREGLHAHHSDAPFHIHVAEQTREVEDCVAVLGQRPVAWLLDHQPVDHRWCLVHSTHLDAAELAGLARSGAVAGLCPTTEANLGDGVFPGAAFGAEGGNWGIGSDSHVGLSPAEELKQLEYSQRLRDRRRNVLASTSGPQVATSLYLGAVAGGAQASGRPVSGITVGQRADFVVLDGNHPDVAERTGDQALAGWVFGPRQASAVADVVVGGRYVVQHGHQEGEEAIAEEYRRAIRALINDEETP
jgi:formimidoylglutamate deiminase